MNEAARRAGVAVEWRETRNAREVNRALDNNLIDLSPAAISTPERRQRYHLTDPWWNEDLAMLVRSDGPQTEAALSGKRIALKSGLLEETARREFPKAVILPAQSADVGTNDAAAKVCRGEVDAALMTHRDADLTVGVFRPADCDRAQLVVLDTSATQGLSLMSRPGDAQTAERFRSAIDDMAADGTLAEIAGRHPGIPASSAIRLAERSRQSEGQRRLRFIIGALSFISIVSAAAALYLRWLKVQLQHSNAQIEAVLDSIPEPVVVVEANGKIGRTNRAFQEDRIAGDTIAKSEQHIEVFSEDGRPIPLDQWPVRRVLRGETVRALDVVLSAQGVRTSRRLSGCPVYDKKGRITHAVMTVFDVTDQKRMSADLRASNDELRAVFEMSPTGIYVADRDHNVVNRNHVHRAMFPELPEGYAADEHRTLLDQFQVWTAEGVPVPVEDYPSQRALRGETLRNERFRIRGAGPVIDCLISAVPINDADGRVCRAIVSVHDITEIARAEAGMAQTERDLRASNEELQAYAYTVSHDLQEPLRMVSSYVDLLEKRYSDRLDDAALEFMGIIRAGAQRMSTMLADLLKYSRAGEDRGERIEIDAGEVMQETVSILRRRIEETHAEVTWSGLPLVAAFPGRLDQILQNLVENALKYAKRDEPPRVVVEASREGPFWRFSVTDNGIGIDTRYANKIFRVFQRLHGRGETEGNGVGLAIVRRLVDRHGGRVWLDWSEVGKGSRFCFTLPAAL